MEIERKKMLITIYNGTSYQSVYIPYKCRPRKCDLCLTEKMIIASQIWPKEIVKQANRVGF